MSSIPPSTEAGDTPSSLLVAIRKILRPLVRLLLHVKVTFPQLAELLKSIYIDVAEDEFKLSKKMQTDTRLSLLTGIHRKDVKRLRQIDSTKTENTRTLSISVQIVSRWIGEGYYQDEQGKPLILPFKKQKDAPSFESLVVEVCKQDIRPRVILDDWLNLGIVRIVHIDAKKNVQLNTQAFVPSKGLDEKAFFLGHNISDHLTAATHNILNYEPAFFERCAYFDGLTQDSIDQLNEVVEEKGMQTLLAINELAIKLKTQDMANTQEKHRINVGLYVYHKKENKNE